MRWSLLIAEVLSAILRRITPEGIVRFLILLAVFAVLGMAVVIAVSRKPKPLSVIRGGAAGLPTPVALLLPLAVSNLIHSVFSEE